MMITPGPLSPLLPILLERKQIQRQDYKPVKLRLTAETQERTAWTEELDDIIWNIVSQFKTQFPGQNIDWTAVKNSNQALMSLSISSMKTRWEKTLQTQNRQLQVPQTVVFETTKWDKKFKEIQAAFDRKHSLNKKERTWVQRQLGGELTSEQKRQLLQFGVPD